MTILKLIPSSIRKAGMSSNSLLPSGAKYMNYNSEIISEHS
jgi:hypothetical protein